MNLKEINKEIKSHKDMLESVGLAVPEDVIKKWTPDQKRIVRDYAVAALSKDKNVKVPVMPQFLRDYQV